MKMKIQRTDKIIIIFYAFLAISFTVGMFHISSTYIFDEEIRMFSFLDTAYGVVKVVDVNQEEAFLIMTDVKNYPKMLPKNIISVNIINQIDNKILAEYEVVELGIRTKLLVNHMMYPYDKHIVEVMEGDAKGTKLTQDFTTIYPVTIIPPECIGIDKNDDLVIDADDLISCKSTHTAYKEYLGDCLFLDKCTKIDSKIELDLKGLLSPFRYLPEKNLNHAANTVISSFTNNMEIKTENGKIIDDLYREILLRPADKESLEHWGALLDNEDVTVDKIRAEILNSDESKSILLFQEMKTVDELDDETKKIIDDLYREILLRPGNTEAFEYWGSLLEIEKITKAELRKSILKSPEALSLKQSSEYLIFESIYTIFHEVYEINGLYREIIPTDVLPVEFFILDPRIDRDKLDEMTEEMVYRVHIEETTLDELRLEIEQLEEDGIDFFVDDLESVNEQFLDWQKRFVDKTDDFCYVCKWGAPQET
jgi:hypothetical protein